MTSFGSWQAPSACGTRSNDAAPADDSAGRSGRLGRAGEPGARGRRSAGRRRSVARRPERRGDDGGAASLTRHRRMDVERRRRSRRRRPRTPVARCVATLVRRQKRRLAGRARTTLPRQTSPAGRGFRGDARPNGRPATAGGTRVRRYGLAAPAREPGSDRRRRPRGCPDGAGGPHLSPGTLRSRSAGGCRPGLALARSLSQARRPPDGHARRRLVRCQHDRRAIQAAVSPSQARHSSTAQTVPPPAEDVVQDVFTALPRAANRFRGEVDLETFLLAIAVKRVRRQRRAALRRRKALERLRAAEPRRTLDPEQDTYRRELGARLGAALDRLPLPQRVAFVLCEVEELTAGQAATIADAPEATIRTRLFHARRRLRELLAEERF